MTTSQSTLSSNIVNLVQQHWCDILNADSALSAVVHVLPENTKDIEFEIKQALANQGIAAIVMTPNLTYRGRDLDSTYWDINGMEITFTENPIVNRASSKDPNTFATAQDCACRAAQVLTGPKFESAGRCVVKQQQTGEFNGLLVSKILVDCMAELHSDPLESI